MPYQIVVNGVVREFEFYAPPGWEYFVEDLFATNGRDGLPLVTMLHGGGVQDVETFKTEWPFPAITLGSMVNVVDRFFILVPYGLSYLNQSGAPLRTWNYGFEPTITSDNDVTFINQATAVVKGWLDDRLTAIGSARRSIDDDRRFLFGYSAGGKMCYRLAAANGNTYAAIWVQSASFGGTALSGKTALVENAPAGVNPVSLFVHHGDLDETVVPGTLAAVNQSNISVEARNLLILQGLTAPDDSDYAISDRSLAGATEVFKTLNSLLGPPFTDTVNNLDSGGTNTSRRREWRNAASDPNPVVVLYRDPDMTHTNFVSSGFRYFDHTDVWAWFKSQTP